MLHRVLLLGFQLQQDKYWKNKYLTERSFSKHLFQERQTGFDLLFVLFPFLYIWRWQIFFILLVSIINIPILQTRIKCCLNKLVPPSVMFILMLILFLYLWSIRSCHMPELMPLHKYPYSTCWRTWWSGIIVIQTEEAHLTDHLYFISNTNLKKISTVMKLQTDYLDAPLTSQSAHASIKIKSPAVLHNLLHLREKVMFLWQMCLYQELY